MIFVDAGAFIARFRESDDHHVAAVHGWAELARSKQPLYTSNLVLMESAKLLAEIRGYRWAAARAAIWLDSRELRVLRSGIEEEIEATGIMQKFADQRVGLVDCVSIVLMRRHAIRKAFAFDRHFRLAGFQLWPGEERK
jgi:uncharacterized protein